MPELVTDQRRERGVLAVENRGHVGAIDRKCALVMIAAEGAHGAKAEALLVKSSLAEGVAAAHIAASVIVAHFKAGEIFGAGGIRRCGRRTSGQAEAEEYDSSCSA